ncbi:MAG: hypothetical protein HY898_31955 [Deltaproteobacteria bacterium]|nr:hypothetical protein [Deltaproteobacteria bacterium]
MTILAASVAALHLLRKYKCPHCGAEQNRLLPPPGSSLKCNNCLQALTSAQWPTPASTLRRR